MTLPSPYLIFLGDVETSGHAKTAFGLAQWCPERCVGQLRYPGCPIDLALPDMNLEQAVEAGAKTLLIGIAPAGGAIQPNWINTFLAAIESGLSIVAGLHTKLNDNPQLTAAAQKYGVDLIDIRTPPAQIPVGSGKKRTGKRLLTVGTDCAVGKKYAALAIANALKQRGVNCHFRATGQTGIMIAGEGIPIDSVVSDFIAGAAEVISPGNEPGHWDIIEGQGSLFHPAYAGVSLGLLHGSQPDAIVLCHDPSRPHLLGWPDYLLPDINQCIDDTLARARLTNPAVRCLGICVNTSQMDNNQKNILVEQISNQTGLPCVDPLATGVEPIIENLLAISG